MENDEKLVDEKAVAEELGVSPHTLRWWRSQRKGPKFLKLEGTLVRYRIRDVRAYQRRQEIPTEGSE
jgi:transposase-like protein